MIFFYILCAKELAMILGSLFFLKKEIVVPQLSWESRRFGSFRWNCTGFSRCCCSCSGFVGRRGHFSGSGGCVFKRIYHAAEKLNVSSKP